MKRTRGFSLLEAMIALGITSLIAGAVLSSVISTRDTTNEIGVENDLVSTADRGLAVLENELRSTALDPAAGLAVTSSFSITLHVCTGFDTTKNLATYGPAITYQFIALPPQKDGIANEYKLARSFAGGAYRDIIGTGVTNPGFGLVSGAVTVNFTMARNVFISQTGKRDVRRRAVSRTYKVAP
jgi:type II secretory pathway pseudopilin PulG